MAGKRQHIIPRFLLKGFANGKKKGKPQIWVYDNRNDSPYLSVAENIAVENKFYVQGDDEADTSITAHENKWAKLVRDLRNGDASALVSPDIPVLLWHLEARSKNFREGMTSAVQKMVPGIFDELRSGDVEDLCRYIMKNFDMDKYIAIIESLVSKFGVQDTARKMGLTGTHIDKSLSPRDLLYFLLRDCFLPALRKNKSWQFETKIQEDRIKSIIPQALRTGHIQGLIETHSESSERDVSFYRQLEYEVLHFEDNSVILGDSVIMRLTEEGKYDKKLSIIDKMRAVALPLSSNRILVGHRKKDKVDIDLSEFKKAVARSSMKFFLGAFNSDENRCLHKIIGTEDSIISDDELDGITTSLWS